MTTLPLLVSAELLAQHLDDPGVLVIDATVFLTIPADGSGAVAESGRQAFDAAHIPGAQFADLLALSDPEVPAKFKFPAIEVVADGLAALGVTDDVHVVTYDGSSGVWGTRLWWMLRYLGLTNVSVLDGGFGAWQAGNHPTTDATTSPASTDGFTVNIQPQLFANKDEVADHAANGGACIINALPTPLFTGEIPTGRGRAGHIPTSISHPHGANVDPETGRLLPLETLRETFANVLTQDKIITYCGGGIAATGDTFVLALLGRDDVAVYDGSLVEWGADPDAPLVMGD